MNLRRHVPASDPRDLAAAYTRVIRRYRLKRITRFVTGRKS